MSSMKKRGAKNKHVDLLETTKIINEHLRESLFQEVYQKTRTNERERLWSFQALAQFWIGVVLESPDSLTGLLDLCRRNGHPLMPKVKATPEAFFKRCQTFSWRFFAALFQAFRVRARKEAAQVYAQQLSATLKRFSLAVAVDGSKIAQVAHRLKILRNAKKAVLPGSITALYDLSRGILQDLLFEPDVSKGELHLALDLIERLPQGTLVIGDRLFGCGAFFEHLSHFKLWGLTRYRLGSEMIKTTLLGSWQWGGRETLEEWLVDMGSGQQTPTQTLRYFLYKKGQDRRELVTNILDRERLSAQEALEVYPHRWSVERMFFDLKEVLGLNTLYSSSPNAVGIQVYVSALVHTAFRIAQGKIAQKHKIPPEDISPAKLFPKMALACKYQALLEGQWLELGQANPKTKLKRPDISQKGWTWATLEEILVKKKIKPRSKRKKRVMGWASFARIPGGKKYLKN